ncbi:uncharacterized protein TNCT_502491 [Trichonephila clavata]|uniref:Uncharacterized protein n=1 Tax=Trichonephila clavata TaxID=2740835 RepID=A0A8X6HF00_TRICU|nr:uncharacterized protein TNCT_502491 [Trichonephila clavata]
MGSFTSKPKERMETPITRPCALKRIEDPRSPTEEISRTPIEVADKSLRDSSEVNYSLRINTLKEQNQYSALGSSPQVKKEFFGKDFKKLKSTFASALERETNNDIKVLCISKRCCCLIPGGCISFIVKISAIPHSTK